MMPYWGIDAAPSFPWNGSAIVIWNSRIPAPPSGNTPPFAPDCNSDRHSVVRRPPAAQLRKSEFLGPSGALVDTCGAAPCLAPF
ncbi:MAG: hypothetical protein FJW88_01715 [Actinobacteria bacterium]|nr:hypothetical protein [Actinomycetota bacterium]